MFICNFHINSKKIFRLCLTFMIIAILLLFVLVIYRIFSNNRFKVSDIIKNDDITKITPDNYTNYLHASYEDIDSYIGTKIQFTGYIYRLIDFEDTQFVLARDMKLENSPNQFFVVGFLCEFDDAKDFQNNEWVEITGEITCGKYHNENVPLIKVIKMEKTEKPNENELYVSSPDNTYIPTSAMF